ncbi:MAG: hypothetical protein V8Q84_02315 [Bilophila sp.]
MVVFLTNRNFKKFSELLRQQAPQCENAHPHCSEITEEISQPIAMTEPFEYILHPLEQGVRELSWPLLSRAPATLRRQHIRSFGFMVFSRQQDALQR